MLVILPSEDYTYIDIFLKGMYRRENCGDYIVFFDEENYMIKKINGKKYLISQYRGLTPSDSYTEIDEIARLIQSNFVEGEKREIIENMMYLDDKLDGKYIVLNTSKNYLYRDILGLQSLYYDGGRIFSDEKKSLWKIKKFNTYSLAPNLIYKINVFSLSYIKTILKLPTAIKTKLSLEDISRIYLEYTLLRTEKICKKENIKEVGISFSGGVDSSFVTWLTSQLGLATKLLTVGTSTSIDKSSREISKKAFPDSETIFIELSLEKLEKDLDKLIYIVEEYSPLSISIAIPQYYVFKESDTKYIFVGQGSDEIFGGYTKYLERIEQAQNLIRKDLIKSYRINFEREDKLSRWFKKRIYYPLISPSILYLGLLIPIRYKIKDARDNIRKWIIRIACRYGGVPDEICFRRKHSMQYSSESMKILRKLSKKRNMKPIQLLYRIYRDMRSRTMEI